MRGMRPVRICAIAIAVQFTLALSVLAQLTTGSVAGTVKDAQGGVIPGATVTLVSETRGTKSIPVVPTRPATSCSRTSPPTPTPSKSRCRRSRPSGRPASRSTPAPQVAVGDADARSRRRDGDGRASRVKSPHDPDGERRAVLRRSRPRRSRTCRSPAAASSSWRSSRPASS